MLRCIKISARTSLYTILPITIIFFIAELVCGNIFNSLVLQADAFHMLSDIISQVVGIVAEKVSTRKRADKNGKISNTFGWERANVIGSLINSVFLIALCFNLLVESVKKFIEPELSSQPYALLGVGLGGLLVNAVGMLLLHDHAHGHDHHHFSSVDNLPQNLVNKNNSNQRRETYQTEKSQMEYPLNTFNNVQKKDEIKNETGLLQDTENIENLRAKNPLNEENHLNYGDLDQVEKFDSRNETIDSEMTNSNKTPNISRKLTFKKLNESYSKEIREHMNSISSEHNDPIEDLDKPPAIIKTKSEPTTKMMNLRAVYLHLLGDLLGSFIVILNAILILYVKKDAVKYADPTLTLVTIVILCYGAVPIATNAVRTLIEMVPHGFSVKLIKEHLVSKFPNIVDIHDFHVWRFAGSKIIASVHVIFKTEASYNLLVLKMKSYFHNIGIHSVTIQPEFASDWDDIKDFSNVCLLQCPEGSICHSKRCC